MRFAIDLPVYPPGLEALRALPGVEVDCLESSDPKRPARELDPARVAGAEVLFSTYLPTNLAAMAALRWIQIVSTGYQQLIGIGLTERGIHATNSRGCFDAPIAEWNVAMMINLVRNLRQLIRNQEAAVWDQGAVFQREIRDLTVGFWGYGGIARETTRLCRHLGMRVHVLTRKGVMPRKLTYALPGTGDPEGVLPHRVFTAGEELLFLRDLDFLIVSVPLTGGATDGMIGEQELQGLPCRAFLLNPARGPIIQEAALIRALQEGWIAGAALDTHHQYPPPPEHPLWRQPNVILTPHISGSSRGPYFEQRLWDLFVQNAARFSRGEPLLNELTPAELAGK